MEIGWPEFVCMQIELFINLLENGDFLSNFQSNLIPWNGINSNRPAIPIKPEYPIWSYIKYPDKIVLIGAAYKSWKKLKAQSNLYTSFDIKLIACPEIPSLIECLGKFKIWNYDNWLFKINQKPNIILINGKDIICFSRICLW